MSKKSASPVIGISVGCSDTPSTQAMAALMVRLGASPLLLDKHAMRDLDQDVALIDAIILMGNDLDIDPNTYIHRYPVNDGKRHIHPETKNETACEFGTARAEYEYKLIDAAIASKMPLIGICGGMQRINVHLGGTLHQHLPDLVGDHRHCQRTRGVAPTIGEVPIIIEGRTLLAEIAESITMPFVLENSMHSPKVILENSVHHQAIDMIAPGLIPSCFAEGIRLNDRLSHYLIKAIESSSSGKYSKHFILGIQWHPEFCASSFGECMTVRLIEEAEKFRKNCKSH